jgi:DNA polymerase-3 subunit alpha
VKNGVNAEVANHIFDLMEKFAGYGFNKSHSASYALIAYQTAWLKTHYPAAFMAAVLSTDMDRTEKVIIFLDECETLKLHVSPPDINRSDYFFRVFDENQLLYGLGAIKGAGQTAIENIVAAREQGGEFKNLFDFCQRVELHKVNRRTLEAFIKSGCFDCFGKNRATLMASLPAALQQAEQALHNQTMGQQDLLGAMQHSEVLHYIDADPWREDVQLQGEKETLGFYLTGHPLNRHLNELVHFTTCRIAELHPAEHKNARAAGIILNIRTRQTKRGDRIAIFTLDDGSSQIEVVCFAEAFQKYRALITEDQLIIVDGEVSLDEFSNSPRLVSRDMFTIDEARTRFAKHLQINLPALQDSHVDKLKHLLANHLGGNCPILLRVFKDNAQADIKLGKKWQVKPSDALLDLLRDELASAEMVY